VERTLNENFGNFVDLLELRADHQPNRTAYTFLVDGRERERQITYAELRRHTRSLAARLQDAGAEGEPVLVLLDSGIEYIVAVLACFYAGAIAVPAYLPRAVDRKDDRLTRIAADAGATIGITSASLLASGTSFMDWPNGMRWLRTEQDGIQEQTWRRPGVGPHTLALLQYTSGSTTQPRGVKITHANLLANQRAIKSAFGHSEESIGVGWLPLHHDMGLIGNVLQSLFAGFHCVLMSPMRFIQEPYLWLAAISRYRATTSGAPNFAFDLCTRRVTEQQKAGLDLGTWDLAFVGAEPVRADTLDRFCAAFGPCGFRAEALYPCYGLAEATLFVSGGVKGSRAPRETNYAVGPQQRAPGEERATVATGALVGCGWVPPNHALEIVDPSLGTLCPPGEVGEIWIAGPSVATGYWKRCPGSDPTFEAQLPNRAEVSYLRTGDLGFVKGGQLFVAGRIKDLIIIRGENHYPHDIESTVGNSHSALRRDAGAAFAVDVGGEEGLVLVHELERRFEPNVDEIIEAICRAVTREHGVQVHAVALIAAHSIPRTSSGKVQRFLCKIRFEQGTLRVLSQRRILPLQHDDVRSMIMARLRRKIASVLESATEPAPTQNLRLTGLDSLMAIELKHYLESAFGVALPTTALLRDTSLDEIVDQIVEQISAPPLPIPTALALPAAARNAFPLSRGQQALWFLCRMDPENNSYNVGEAFAIEGPLDLAALRRAFERVVGRHPMLRMTIADQDGVPIHRLDEEFRAALPLYQVAEWDDESLAQHLVEQTERPFDLETGPLFRAGLYARPEGRHVLLIAMHHIVEDFWSLLILLRELASTYSGEKEGSLPTLPPPTAGFDDYVDAEAAMLAGPEGQAHARFWQASLSPIPAALDLPQARPRPAFRSSRGATFYFCLDPGITRALKELAKQEGVTLYTVLLSIFLAQLHRYSGRKQFLIGSPLTTRTRPEWASIVGYFDNLVPISADFSGRPTFRSIITRVRETVLQALDRQNYPFPRLVELLQPLRTLDRSPLFDIVFVFRKTHLAGLEPLTASSLGAPNISIEFGDLRMRPLALPRRVSQFDLTLALAEVDETLHGAFEYSTDLFDAAAISGMAADYSALAVAYAQNPDQCLRPFQSEAPRQTTADAADNSAQFDDPPCGLLHQLFEERARLIPARAAICDAAGVLDYGTLERRANHLAQVLRELGAAANKLVAVSMERGREQVLAVLAILKAGAAYLPIDPQLPEERRLLLLERGEVGIVLTQARFRTHRLWPDNVALLAVDTDLREQEAPPQCLGRAHDLAYVIYTSGSTGEPKGVMITHRAALNTITDINSRFAVGPLDRTLALSSLSFDLSVYDVFGSLAAGATIVIPPPADAPQPQAWRALLTGQSITIWNSVPALMQLLVDEFEDQSNAWPSLRLVMLSGDWIPLNLPEQVRRLAPHAQIIALGGATEASIWSTLFPVEEVAKEWRSIPYGRPMKNQELHILDEFLQPCPVSVMGQLYIGGAGLAEGYWRNREQTVASFLRNPRTGQRIYRTGDLARLMPNGEVELLGRADWQVKVHGHRIELGEVEWALRTHPAIRDAAVIGHGGDGPLVRLVAYYVTRPSARVAAEDLRSFLENKLPIALVPSVFVPIERLPLTENGKLDRKALPPLAVMGRKIADAPSTASEEALAEIWRQLLGLDTIGVHEDFFAIGGDSILSVKACLAARRRGIFLSPEDIFAHRTIANIIAEEARSARRQPNQSDLASWDDENPLPPLTPHQLQSVLAELDGRGEADAG
jgi:amino acid adenylation domain-containing protein